MAAQIGEVLFIEDLGDEPHAGAEVEVGSVAGGNPSALLATVLESIKSIEREPGYVVSGAVYAKDATGFARAIVFGDHYALVALLQGDVNGLFSISGELPSRQRRG
jgi:hypothetical protein